MKSPSQQLLVYKTAYNQLEYSFKNNLNVIKQLQQENNELQNHLQQVAVKYESELERALLNQSEKYVKQQQELQLNFAREIDLVKKQYEGFITEINNQNQHNNQQLIIQITKKHKQELQSIRETLNKEVQSALSSKQKYQLKCKSLQQSITNQVSKSNDATLKLISLQSEIQHLQKQRKQSQSLFSNYQQEIESLKQSSNSWEDVLKKRITQLEQQKSTAEQECAEMKFLNKEKIKKLKQECNRKITQAQESHTVKLTQLMRETREIKFKFETIKLENTELKNEIEIVMKDNKSKEKNLEEERNKFRQVEHSVLTIKEKQFEIKNLHEERKRLQNQLKSVTDEKSSLKQEYQRVNQQREYAQKALERLKVQLINKSKQCQDTKKQIQKIKYKNQLITNQPQFLTKGNTETNNYTKGLQKYQKQDNVIGQVEYSQCFTQDMGPVDQNFFLPKNSGLAKSPFYNQSQPYPFQQYPSQTPQPSSKISHLMKRIGQLQVENTELKSTIKIIKQEMERAQLTVGDKISLKDREIRLGKDQNLMLREKINDKEQQVMAMSQTIKMLKTQKQRLGRMDQELKDGVLRKQENQKLRSVLEEKQTLISELKEEIHDLIKERQTLQNIADQLKTEVNFYREQISQLQQEYQHSNQHSNPSNANFGYSDMKNKSNLSSKKQKSRNSHNNTSSQQNTKLLQQNMSQILNQQRHNRPQFQSNLTENQNLSNILSQISKNTRQKSPQNKSRQQPKKKKLHELIKQKNALQAEGVILMGKRATIQTRKDQARLQHIGTKSQKDVYDKLERKSKSKSKEKPIKMMSYVVEETKYQRVEPNQQNYDQSQLSDKNETESRVMPNSKVERPKGALQQLRQQQTRKSQIASLIKKQMLMKNDSIGDELENVSMSYWDQQ